MKIFTTSFSSRNLVCSNKLYLWFLVVFLFGNILHISGQSENDFRSIPSGGNWNAPATWEQYIGGVWGSIAYFPGGGTTNNVTVNGPVSVNVSVNLSGSSNLIVEGTLTLSSFDFTVGGSTTVNGAFTDASNTGINTFKGALTVSGTGTFTTTSVTTTGRLIFENGINQQSTGAINIGVANFNTNTQKILVENNTGGVTLTSTVNINAPFSIENGGDGTGAGVVTISATNVNSATTISRPVIFSSTVTIANGITVTNQSQVVVTSTLNGIGVGSTSTWLNSSNSTLEYRGTAVPMALGGLNAVASNNTVYYNANADQTLKAINYYNLRTGTNGVASNRNKTFETSVATFSIAGDFTIGDRSILNLGASNKNISVTGNVTLETSNTWLRTTNTDNTIHTLTIGGILSNNGGEVRLRYDNSTRYCDLTMTGSGDIIQGTGSLFYLRNLTLTNVAAKTVSYSGNIDFYSGTGSNVFTNDGGDFIATAGAFRFLDAFSIAGTGAISFNNLQCGNNNQTIQTLNRDVIVNGTLTLNHSNTLNSHLSLNGYTLTVNGGCTRSNSGEFGGSSTSNLILGNGNTPGISGTLNFETGFNQLQTLTHNVVNGATYYSLGAPLTVENLNVISGELRNTSDLTLTNSYNNAGVYNQTLGTTYFNKPAGAIAITGGGTHSFYTLQISDGTVTTDNSLNVGLNFVNNSNEPNSFVASVGDVNFIRAGDQYIQGSGTGLVSFYNLIFPSQAATRNRFLATNFTVANTMQIGNSNLVYFENSAWRTLDINNLIIGGGASGQLLVLSTVGISVSSPGFHQLNINGKLTVNSGATINLRNATSRYVDVNFKGAGEVLDGTGTFIFHSILLDNVGAKSFNTTSNVNLYDGANTLDYFTNNGGAFTMPSGILYFRDNLTDWTLGGTGELSMNSLQIGGNTTTNVTLTRDVTVVGNLIFYQASSTNYLALNGYALTLLGNHTRIGNGRIRGGTTSTLTINGSGNFTTSFAFDQAILGTTNRLAQLNYNRGSDGAMLLGNLMEVDELNIQQGIVNASAGSIYVYNTTNLIVGSFIDNNNGGVNSFNGVLNIATGTSFNPTSTSVLNLSGTINNEGLFVKDGTGTTNFVGNAILNGSAVYSFLNGAVTVSNGVIVENNSVALGTGVTIIGALNGAGVAAQWTNKGVLTYLNAATPMATGVLDAGFVGNVVAYNRVQNTQSVKSTTYHHLQLVGGGTRSLAGAIGVNGDLTISEENLLYTAEYQIDGSPTGILTMLESSELRIGRDVATSPTFPTGFVRANMVFSNNSLVSYNGQTQVISNEPIYQNLSITNGGTKTIAGDVTVDGYLNVATGTFSFGNVSARVVTVNGDLYGTGGRIDMSGGGLLHVLDLYGTLNQISRFTAALNSRVRYLSSDNQQIFSPSSGDYYGKLEVAGGSVKTIELDTEVRGELILTSGVLQLGSKNLTLTTGGASAVPITGSAFSDNNMVETNGTGKFIKSGSGGAPYNYLLGIYPVGSSGRYSPMNIISLVGSTGTGTRNIQIKAVSSRHPSVSAIYDALLKYWDITTTLTTPKGNFTFGFNDLDVIGNVGMYKGYTWNGTAFVNPVGSTVASNTITYPANTDFGNVQVTAYDNVTIRKTLYSYKDGSWDDPDTWTTDPSGQNLEGAALPGNSDNVVVLASRTVHLANNVATQGLIITLNSGSTLDLLDKGFTNPVSVLQGEGLLKLASNQMPPVSQNSLVEIGGGTVEYNVTDPTFVLNSQQKYNHLNINLSNSSNIAVLENDLVINGNLQVLKGKLQIFKNDAAATLYNPISIDVKGDLVVASVGGILTGTASTTDGVLPPSGTTPGSLVPRYYDGYHKMYVGGNFYNQGVVKFVSSDITTIDFENLTSRGAVTVRFSGIANATMDCLGTTDFYNLIVDKGVGIAAELNVNASHPHNFRLFGPNRFVVPVFGVNPEVRKALWIRNGTLRLTGSTTIPSLTEGYRTTDNSSYVIPVNGALVLDGPDVTVLSTADSPNEVTAAWGVSCSGITSGLNYPEELSVNGRLAINDGYLSTRFSGGVFFSQLSGELVVTGGKLSTRQIRTNQAGTTLYDQRGGNVELLGAYTYNTSGSITSIDDIRNVPINYVYNATRLGWRGSFDWISSANVFSMTGGVMDIYNTSGGGGSCALRIMSNASNLITTNGQINMHLSRNTTYDIEVPNGAIPNLTANKSAGTGYVRLLSNLLVNGSLTLNGISQLNANTASYNLSIANNFTIGAGAIYNPNQNITTFYSDSNAYFNVDGTIVGDLYDLHVEKVNSTLSLSGSNANIKVRDGFDILSGTFNDGGFTVTAKGSLSNSGTHTGTGKIYLAEALASRTIGGDGNGIWGNIELNEATIVSILTSNQTIAGQFTLTDGIMDLKNYGLALNGALLPNDITQYSETKMFMTDGNSSDGALIRSITANGDWIFPIGTSQTTTRFTPVVATVTDYNDDGKLQITPVAKELPLLDKASSDVALQYYWKVNHSDFTTLPQASYLFKYSALDVLVVDDDLQYVAGKVVGASRSHLGSGVDNVAKTITYSPAEIVQNASYTAAHPNRFGGIVPVFYSRNCGVYSSNWDDLNTWSETAHTGAPATRIPADGDIVYIGNGGGCDLDGGGDFHWIEANVDATVAEINFSPVPVGVRLPRLIVPQDKIVSASTISGVGTVLYRITPTQSAQVIADMGAMLSQAESQIIYELQSSGTVSIAPIAAILPNVNVEAEGDVAGNRYLEFTDDVAVSGHLIINNGATLALSEGGFGNISVAGNTQLGGNGFGRILFKGDGNVRTFSSNNILLKSEVGNSLSVVAGSAGLLHKLIVTGDFTAENGTISLFSNNSGGSNVELTFNGSNNSIFSSAGTTPSLYRIIVDKGTTQTTTLNFNSNFTLGAPADIAVKPLNLMNGTTILNNSSINLILSTGGAFYSIPSTTALVVSSGKVSITANYNGIDLKGKLRVDNSGIVSLGDGSTTNRLAIQYQGVNPEIEIANNGLLEVNTQIRRPTNSLAGSLSYTQTGGQVVLYGQDLIYGRAKLEVLNTGSAFNMSGGTLTIRRGYGSTFGDLYLTPETSSVTGGEIIFSQGTINNNQLYTMNSSVALPNLTIAGNVTNSRTATLTLMTLPLQVNQNMTFSNALARFNTNNQDVTLIGNLDYLGTWINGTDNDILFNGTTQTIKGSPTFNNVIANSSTSLTVQPASVVTVDGDLFINTPQLIDGANPVVVKKDVVNNGAFVNSNPSLATSGLKLRGATNQKLSGTGSFGLIELDNISGVNLLNSISMVNNLTLTRGLFNIGSNLLSFGPTAQIISGSAFSDENMILSDGVYGITGGVQKTIQAGASSFVFPTGVSGKYTPITLTVDVNSVQADVLVRPVNQAHPAVDDANFVLQYFWVVESNSISGFSGSLKFDYLQADVRDDESSYISARLNGFDWTKNDGIVDDLNNTITFPFTSVNDLSGEYTSGIDAYIPDEVPLFISAASGAWTDKDNWVRDGGGIVPNNGPFGHRVHILPGHTINMTTNSRRVYTTKIDGRLEIATTYGHNLGEVDGVGELSIETNQLPAGKFDDFFSCTGGTMEYAGNSTYTIGDRYSTFRNLKITGAGIKTLPNAACVICEDLTVEAGTLKLSHFSLGTAIKTTTINGSLIIKAAGVFDSDTREYVVVKGNIENAGVSNFKNNYLLQRFVLNGTALQQLVGNFNGVDQSFYDLELNNSLGFECDNDVEVLNYCYNTSGVITMLNNKAFVVSKVDGMVSNPVYPNSNNYVHGYLSRKLASASSNPIFAIGKLTAQKPISLTERSVNNQYWGAEYFDESTLDNGYDPESMVAPLTMVSNSEYFAIKGPSGATGKITLPLTGTNDIAQLVQNLTDLRIARWNGTAWEQVGGTITVVGNKTNGSIAAQTLITFSGTVQYYTIATVMPRWQWTGTVNTDWFTGGNWTGGSKPIAISLVILGNTVNKPIVSNSELALAGSITMSAGAALTLNEGARMTVNGAIVNTSASILVKNSVANPTSLLVNGSVSEPVSIEWVYPTRRFIYIGHCVDGRTFADYTAKDPAVYMYRFTAGAWSQITSGAYSFDANKIEGYSVGFNGVPDVTMTLTGALRTASYGPMAINNWHLIGNPYSTYLDLENAGFILGTNALKTVWTTNSGTGTAAYATYNIETQVGANGGTRYVAPGQSFWVRTYVSSTLTINNSVRTHATGALKGASMVDDVLRLTVSRNNIVDESVLVFRSIGSEGYSSVYDSEKRFSTGTSEVSLFTQKDSRNLIINALPENVEGRIVPLYLNVGTLSAGSLTINATNLNEFKSDVDVFLVDKLEGVTINLREQPTYTFTTEAGNGINRFNLKFASSTSIDEVPTDIKTESVDDIVISAYAKGNKAVVNVVDSEFSGKVTIDLYDAVGRLQQKVVSKTEQTDINLSDDTQLYMIRVTYKDEVKTIKLVKPVAL